LRRPRPLRRPPRPSRAVDRPASRHQGRRRKVTKLGYQVKIRIAYLGPDQASAKQRMQAIVGGFKQFNTTNLNGFTNTKMYNSQDFIEDYQARLFFDQGYILNIEELASLYHLPHKSVETPNMVWTTAKTSEPPSNLPSKAPPNPKKSACLASATSAAVTSNLASNAKTAAGTCTSSVKPAPVSHFCCSS
jgi:hypothetical protein